MFQTSLCKLLGIKYPIIQGALGGANRPVSDSALIANVSNAGGLGILSTWNLSSTYILNEINKVRKLTDKPFGVNVAASHSSYDFSKKAKLIANAGVKIVTTGRGDPNIPAISILKEYEIIVMPVVGTVRQAVSVEKKGADAVVASGCEAGGHVGDITTMALIPQVVDAVKIPVVAAGGIGDSRGFLAALALGASGVQMGTRFVITNETVLPSVLKAKILQAVADDTVITTMRTGWPTRVLRSRFTDEWEKLKKKEASPKELRNFRRRVYKSVKQNIEEDTIGTGQVCGLFHDIKGASEVINEMVDGAYKLVFSLAEMCYKHSC